MANRHVSFLKGMYFFPFGGFFLYDGQPPGWSDAPWKILRTEVGEGVFRGVPWGPGGEITGWWFRICLFSPRTRTLKKLPNLCGKGLCGCRPWKKWMVHGWGTFWPRALRSMPTQTSGHWPTPVKWSWPWCQSSHWRSLALRGLPVSMRSLVPKVISLRSPVWAPCRSLRRSRTPWALCSCEFTTTTPQGIAGKQPQPAPSKHSVCSSHGSTDPARVLGAINGPAAKDNNYGVLFLRALQTRYAWGLGCSGWDPRSMRNIYYAA